MQTKKCPHEEAQVGTLYASEDLDRYVVSEKNYCAVDGIAKLKHRGYGDTFFIDEAFREAQRQAALSMEGSGSGEPAHAAVSNLFNLGRHLIRAEHYRNPRVSAFEEWSRAVA